MLGASSSCKKAKSIAAVLAGSPGKFHCCQLQPTAEVHVSIYVDNSYFGTAVSGHQTSHKSGVPLRMSIHRVTFEDAKYL